MQVLDSNFVACWKQQYWAPLSWGSMEFSTFLVFAAWTASMTYLTFGKGELQNANHFLSLYWYFSPCYLISHRSLFVFRWFTTVDALSNEKTKNLNSTTWPLKEGTSLLKTCFVNIEWYFKESCYYDGPYRKFAVVTKKLRTATMKNCFIQNHFNPNAQLIFTWKGNQFYHKHFIVV